MLEISAVIGKLCFGELLRQVAPDGRLIGEVGNGQLLLGENILRVFHIHALHAEIPQLFPVARDADCRAQRRFGAEVNIAQREVLAGEGLAELDGHDAASVGVDIFHQHVAAALGKADAEHGAGRDVADGDVVELILGVHPPARPDRRGRAEKDGADADGLAGVLDIFDGDVIELRWEDK